VQEQLPRLLLPNLQLVLLRLGAIAACVLDLHD